MEERLIEQRPQGATPAAEQPNIIDRLGGGLARVVIAVSVLVAVCGFTFWLFFGGSSEPTPTYAQPVYMPQQNYTQQSYTQPAEPESVGYGNKAAATQDGCPAESVIPIWRHGSIAGYGCLRN